MQVSLYYIRESRDAGVPVNQKLVDFLAQIDGAGSLAGMRSSIEQALKVAEAEYASKLKDVPEDIKKRKELKEEIVKAKSSGDETELKKVKEKVKKVPKKSAGDYVKILKQLIGWLKGQVNLSKKQESEAKEDEGEETQLAKTEFAKLYKLAVAKYKQEPNPVLLKGLLMIDKNKDVKKNVVLCTHARKLVKKESLEFKKEMKDKTKPHAPKLYAWLKKIDMQIQMHCKTE